MPGSSARFVSRRDPWLVVLLWLTVLTILGVGGSLWMEPGPFFAHVTVSILSLIVSALVLWVLYGTHYTFEHESLAVRSGPFKWAVPLDQIRSVSPTRNPLSSPACSLDRLAIDYGKKQIMVSPHDKAGFLQELSHRRPGVDVRGDDIQQS